MGPERDSRQAGDFTRNKWRIEDIIKFKRHSNATSWDFTSGPVDRKELVAFVNNIIGPKLQISSSVPMKYDTGMIN